METFEEKQRKIEILDSDNNDDETNKTFVFNGEDHTLGNPLRYMIMKNPDVNFCGYTIPHPSEEKITVRVQTHGKPARDMLIKGLKDLGTLSEHVLRTYEKSVNDYKRRNQSGDETMADKSDSG